MKTISCQEPGKLVIKNQERPKAAQDYAIIKIKRIGVCGTDLHAFEGKQPFFSYPRVLGHELSGEIIDNGSDETYQIGDRVTFLPYLNCDQCIACRHGKENCCEKMQVFGVHRDGGMTTYLKVPTRLLVHGKELIFDELALVEPLAIGAHSIRRANVAKGEYVLVIGAGPIGLGIMEFAKVAGGNVIAVDFNESRLAFCKDVIGITHLINPSKEHMLTKLSEITGGDMPTVILDATGNQTAINDAFKYMAHGGRYVMVGIQKNEIIINHPEFHQREATLMSSRNATRADFEQVISCIEKGLIKPLSYLTHRIAFDQVIYEFPRLLTIEQGLIKAMIQL